MSNLANRLMRSRAHQSNGMPISEFHAHQRAEMRENKPNAAKGVPGKALKNAVDPEEPVSFQDVLNVYEDQTLTPKQRIEKTVVMFKKLVYQDFPPEQFGITG